MDLQYLTQLFATTYDPNPNTRKAGELDVRKVRAHRAVMLICRVASCFSRRHTTEHLYLITAFQPGRRDPCAPADNCIRKCRYVRQSVACLILSHNTPFNRLLHCALPIFKNFIVQRYTPGHLRVDQKSRRIVL